MSLLTLWRVRVAASIASVLIATAVALEGRALGWSLGLTALVVATAGAQALALAPLGRLPRSTREQHSPELRESSAADHP